MLKDLEKGNWIIPPWDPRYGKIGHLWKKYNKDNLVFNLGIKSYRYFIIPELVINKYITTKTGVSNNIHEWNDWKYTNLVDSKFFKNLIKFTTGLSDEEYYLLIIKHSNNINDYTRCACCRSRIEFCNFLRGYNSGGRYEGDLIGKRTCSQSCLQIFKHSHESIYGASGFNDKRINALTKRSWFLNKGNLDDKCILYYTISRGQFKFGITGDFGQREHRYESYEKEYSELTSIYESDRLSIANLEFLIKEKFDYKEYLPIDKSEEFLSEINNIILKFNKGQLTIDL